jgi:hypothetical protein
VGDGVPVGVDVGELVCEAVCERVGSALSEIEGVSEYDAPLL